MVYMAIERSGFAPEDAFADASAFDKLASTDNVSTWQTVAKLA